MTYIHSTKAHGKLSTLVQVCMLSVLPLFTACSDYVDELRDNSKVPVTLYLQSTDALQTRAYLGELDGVDAENAINSVNVWFFDGGNCVGYADAIDNGKITVSVPRSVETVDAYIIANAASAGITGLNGAMTTAELAAKVIDTDKFSAATPVTTVPEGGLPMSRIVKGLSLRDNGEIKTNLGTIDITRAVSKVVFAFGMYTGDFGEIVGISLDGGQIATKEYIFPVAPTGATGQNDYAAPYLGDYQANIVAGQYEATELLLGAKEVTTETTPLVANTAIHTTATTDNPSNYTWTNWVAAHTDLTTDQAKATQYYTDITPFIKKTVYLRESDQKLTGTIYYRMTTATDAPVVTATFEMDAAQDFARNHVWIVYAYFEGGKLYVKPTVAPWENAAELEYTLKMSTNMRLFDSWLYRYDTVDQDYSNWTNWAGSHMAVSSGRAEASATETIAGRPLRSPQIQLVTTGTGTFDLVVDNTDFEIVRTDKDATTGQITGYTASTDGKLTINAGENVYTYFYIVPKEGVTPDTPVAKVSLIYNDPVLGPQKVTYNYNSLPGYSDDSSEIWAYYVAPADYSNSAPSTLAGKFLKMYYQDYNHPLVPTANQS